jgi:2-oxoisovalerate dehydrogenase E1 component
VALPDIPKPVTPPAADGADEPVNFGAAITRALEEVMAADERIRVFGTTKGLQRRFGSDRCFNTPLAEAAIVGRAVGQGIRGLRPSPEIQFFDYIWTGMQQLRSEAATTRWRSNGTWTVPMVLRVPIGGYLTGGSIWHSQCGESIFAHIPGLLVAFPSRARDAVGLLRAAFRGDDPVLFCEHKHLLRQRYTADPYPPADFVVPFGCGEIRRPGTDCTIVTWGATVQKSLDAAAAVAADDAGDIEVIDLRTISPWDKDIVAASVRRTHRLLVVHEDTLTAGFGAEVAAWAGQELFCDLDAPVVRVAALDTPVPYSPAGEQAVLPQVADIDAAVRRLLAF